MSKEMGAGGKFDIFLDSVCGALFSLSSPAHAPKVCERPICSTILTGSIHAKPQNREYSVAKLRRKPTRAIPICCVILCLRTRHKLVTLACA